MSLLLDVDQILDQPFFERDSKGNIKMSQSETDFYSFENTSYRIKNLSKKIRGSNLNQSNCINFFTFMWYFLYLKKI